MNSPLRPSPSAARRARRFHAGLALAACAGLVAGCSSGSSSSSSALATGDFQLVRISVRNGEPWEINRPIELEFSKPVDFSSVDSVRINIQVVDTGAPATGTFSFKRIDSDDDGVPDLDQRNTIVFQPTCPTLADLSDAGFAPGGLRYRLTVAGLSSGGSLTVMSSVGDRLEQTQTREFVTRDSPDRKVLFLDTREGPPSAIVRSASGANKPTSAVSYVEVGSDPDPASRLFFEFDADTQTYSIVPGRPGGSVEAPLNLYSDPDARTAVVLEFDQAIDPDETNISDERVRLEILTSAPGVTPEVWVPIDTEVELVSNCAGGGATVRLTPIGLLPAESRFRVAVLAGFRDIVRDATRLRDDRFARGPTSALRFASLTPPDEGADEFLEEFDFGGGGRGSFEDVDALFETPPAEWDRGKLTAKFEFEGNGGPGGQFDWRVRSGEIFLFDTNFTEVAPVPGTASTPGFFRDGVVDVHDLTVDAGGILRVQGPNLFLVRATGTVRIEGSIEVDGFDAKDVATLNTGHQPEKGGAGGPLGGAGGNASEVTNFSTPRGGTGFGPRQPSGQSEPNAGGQGGESQYAAPGAGDDARRPGGGGGGRFAPDFDLTKAGLFAEQGYPGYPTTGRGVITNNTPALGGLPGVGPFRDGDPSNDFFGVRPIVTPTAPYRLVGLVRGELTRQLAGYGGGGGGDAVASKKYPPNRWDPSSDEKGGGGGGGGGAIRIQALGPIVFSPDGRVQANGARGGAGENTGGLNHIGGTGGSGSGGHVILESATMIDFTDGDPVLNKRQGMVLARGRPGETGDTSFAPANVSYGGGGGPGVVQLHVPSIHPPSSEYVPGSTTEFLSKIVVPVDFDDPTDPYKSLETLVRPFAFQLIPTFASTLKARSKWISVGGADIDPGGGEDLVTFLFDGVEVDDPNPDEQGVVLTEFGTVKPLAPVVGPLPLRKAASVGDAGIQPDGSTLLLVGSDLVDLIGAGSGSPHDIYLRSPSLLEHFAIRVEDGISVVRDFVVAAAAFDDDPSDPRLSLTMAPGGETLLDFYEIAVVSGTPVFSIVPRFFQLATDGLRDSLPDDSRVRFTFEAAADDGFGNPVPLGRFGPTGSAFSTGDIREFNTRLAPGELGFFRFEIEFELGAAREPITLDFVRIPFRF